MVHDFLYEYSYRNNAYDIGHETTENPCLRRTILITPTARISSLFRFRAQKHEMIISNVNYILLTCQRVYWTDVLRTDEKFEVRPRGKHLVKLHRYGSFDTAEFPPYWPLIGGRRIRCEYAN